MQQTGRPEESDDKENLRRWVNNLQLESWQLELLITGFSIFLLVTSLQEFEAFSASLVFDKLTFGGEINPIVSASFVLILKAIPLAMRFFLFSLLAHLLLRGFWIGIVGLSSVSNKINFDALSLQGNFRKYIAKNVRTLDELILYLDKIASVIFAYTYLLAFSIISVVLVGSFLLIFLSISTYLPTVMSNVVIVGVINYFIFFVWFILIVAAIIFFLDTLLFSAFKRSKWFSVLYYPIYRIYSVLSLSFLYRSIYYHLITNYRKKQIVVVSVLLLAIFIVANRVHNWDNYSFFPKMNNENEWLIKNEHYDDQRIEGFIETASIPSRFISNSFLEVFVRYSPINNELFEFLCPDSKNINSDLSFMESMRAGMAASGDSTKTINEVVRSLNNYDEKIANSVGCLVKMYDLYIDGERIESPQMYFTMHENKGERGFAFVLDVKDLTRGRHVLSIDQFERSSQIWGGEITENNIKKENFVKIVFWKE